MQSLFHPPTPLSYFSKLVESDDQLPLFEAAASLAHLEDMAFNVESARDSVDQLVAQLKEQLGNCRSALARLEALNDFFFTAHRFGVNQNDFYDPANSFVHQVLRTHRGIPVSLAVIWLELAQEIGLQAMGIGFPGHFLLSVRLPNGLVVMDPASGASLSREQLTGHLDGLPLAQNLSHAQSLDVEACLRPSTPREVLVRMLRNLLEIYTTKKNFIAQLDVIQRLLILLPQRIELRAERGFLLSTLKRKHEALEDLEWFLSQSSANPLLRKKAQVHVALLRQQMK